MTPAPLLSGDQIVQIATILGGASLLGIAAIITAFATLRKGKGDDLNDRFDQTTALGKFVEERVAAAVAPLQDALKKAEDAIATLQDDKLTSKAILYAYFARLFGWDQRGRQGELPIPEAKHLNALGLDLSAFEDTSNREQVAAAVRTLHLATSADLPADPIQKDGTSS
jgi:hypothetical protein